MYGISADVDVCIAASGVVSLLYDHCLHNVPSFCCPCKGIGVELTR